MGKSLSWMKDFLCNLMELKRKKAELYTRAVSECDDPVGREAFGLLHSEEDRTLRKLEQLEKMLEAENRFDPTCVYDASRMSVTETLITKAKRQLKSGSACSRHIEALDIGIDLEREAITLIKKFLDAAQSNDEKEMLSWFFEEDREHLKTLENLKFYYTNPEAWLMEKGRTGLDGA